MVFTYKDTTSLLPVVLSFTVLVSAVEIFLAWVLNIFLRLSANLRNLEKIRFDSCFNPCSGLIG